MQLHFFLAWIGSAVVLSPRPAVASDAFGLRLAYHPVGSSYRSGLLQMFSRNRRSTAAVSYRFGQAYAATPVGSYRKGLLMMAGLICPLPAPDSVLFGRTYNANPIASYRLGMRHMIVQQTNKNTLTASINKIVKSRRRNSIDRIASAQYGADYSANDAISYRSGLAMKITLALVAVKPNFKTVVVDVRSKANFSAANASEFELGGIAGIASYRHGEIYSANDSPSYRAGLGHEMVSSVKLRSI